MKEKHLHNEQGEVSKQDREQLSGYKAVTLWMTGLSGSGKSTLAKVLEKQIFDTGRPIFRLDGDNLRQGLCEDLGFTSDERSENIRRVAEVAKLFNQAGMSVVCSFISPLQSDRVNARNIIGADNFYEIYVSTPIAVCETRDTHGLYAKARSGEILNFTGISAPYEAPTKPDLSIDTSEESLTDSVKKLALLLA